MKQGIAQYRCERCQLVTFNHESTPVPVDVLKVFMSNDAITSVGDVPGRLMHLCPDGGLGIGKLCGLMPVEMLEEWKKHKAAADAAEAAGPKPKPNAN